MFATARYATALAFTGAILVGGTTPAFAADRGNDNINLGGTLPPVDFTLAVNAPFVAGVPAAITPAMLAGIATAPAEPAAAPLAEAAQKLPIEMTQPRGDARPGPASLRRSLYVSFAALQVMDGLSTRKALSGGAVEANPMMSGIAKNSAALFAVKAGTAAATAFFAERLAQRHPRRATILMAVLNTAYAGVVAHNYRVARNR